MTPQPCSLADQHATETSSDLHDLLQQALPLMMQVPSKALSMLCKALALVNPAEDPWQRFKILSYCMEACDYLGRLKEMKGYSDEAVSLQDAITAPDQRAEYLTIMGTVSTRLGMSATAFEYLNGAIEYFSNRKEPSPMKAQVLGITSVLFQNVGDYENALEFGFRALDVLEQLGNRETIATLQLNLGKIYDRFGETHNARDIFNAVLLDKELNGKEYLHASAFQGLASVAEHEEKLEEAHHFSLKALELYKRLDDRQSYAVMLINHATLCGKLGDHTQTELLLLEALDIAEPEGANVEQVAALVELARLYMHRNHTDRAFALLGRAETLADTLQLTGETLLVYQLYSELYERTGNHAEALEHYRRHAELQERQMGTQQQRAIARVELRHLRQKLGQEKEVLRLRAENAELEIMHKRNELNTITLNLTRQNETLRDLDALVAPYAEQGRGQTRELARAVRARLREAAEGQSLGHLFDEHFRGFYEDFVRDLQEQAPALTPTELKICVLLRMDLSSKQIADLLFSSLYTVKTHRQRIRRKLGLGSTENLGSFLLGM